MLTVDTTNFTRSAIGESARCGSGGMDHCGTLFQGIRSDLVPHHPTSPVECVPACASHQPFDLVTANYGAAIGATGRGHVVIEKFVYPQPEQQDLQGERDGEGGAVSGAECCAQTISDPVRSKTVPMATSTPIKSCPLRAEPPLEVLSVGLIRAAGYNAQRQAQQQPTEESVSMSAVCPCVAGRAIMHEHPHRGGVAGTCSLCWPRTPGGMVSRHYRRVHHSRCG